MTIDFTFSSVSALKEWLKNKRFETGNPEAFDEWIFNLFENGNTISVNGYDYDYFSCLELI